MMAFREMGKKVKKGTTRKTVPTKAVSQKIVPIAVVDSVSAVREERVCPHFDKGVNLEKLIFLSFLSHFRAVLRGSSLAGLRTTSVLKLLPESWGFVCPVHAPDGAPCRLLNHMTASCRITSNYDSEGQIKDFAKIQKSILSVLVGAGVTPTLPKCVKVGPLEVLYVLSNSSIWVRRVVTCDCGGWKQTSRSDGAIVTTGDEIDFRH
ncbi:DNA-directed RNA polymerase I subunit 2 [Tanacetum coccineum]